MAVIRGPHTFLWLLVGLSASTHSQGFAPSLQPTLLFISRGHNPETGGRSSPLAEGMRLRGGAGRPCTGKVPCMSSDLTLYTNKMCPFAQKCWIALEEKQVDFELVEIGLYGAGGKPGWFLKMNPAGQVPVLKHGDKVVVESDDIIKYIDESFGESKALQQHKEKQVEEWLSFLRKEVLPVGKAVICGYGDVSKLQSTFSKVEDLISGPFIAGNAFSLADVAAAPFFYRMFTESSKLGLDPEKHPKLHQWMEAVKARPSFSKTVVRSWWWWW